MSSTHLIDSTFWKKDQLQALINAFPGWSFFIFDEIPSTNEFAKSNLQSTELPALILSANQTEGRGQRGRSWISSPHQNLLFTLAIPFPTHFNTSLFLLNVGHETANALESYLSFKIKVKWPNDLYIGSKKMGGILCEATYTANKPKMLLCGIGINVNQVEFGALSEHATSLSLEEGKQFDLLSLLKPILTSLDTSIIQNAWLQADTVEKINERLLYKDRLVRLNVNDQDAGRAVLIGIDALGKLWFRKEKEEFISFQHENVRISRID